MSLCLNYFTAFRIKQKVTSATRLDVCLCADSCYFPPLGTLVSVLLTLNVRHYTLPLFCPPPHLDPTLTPTVLWCEHSTQLLATLETFLGSRSPLRLNSVSPGNFLDSRLPIPPQHQNWLDVVFSISKRSHASIFLQWCYVEISAFLVYPLLSPSELK